MTSLCTNYNAADAHWGAEQRTTAGCALTHKGGSAAARSQEEEEEEARARTNERSKQASEQWW